MFASWKTSTLGICAIISTVIGVVTGFINGTTIDWTTVVTGITAGWALLHAQDASVANTPAK